MLNLSYEAVGTSPSVTWRGPRAEIRCPWTLFWRVLNLNLVTQDPLMRRKLPPTVCTLILGLMLAGNVFAATTGTTYYIAANGSDSNSGTSKTSPWVHAPGMKNCANTCAATTPQAGDSFIFRGGDTWHFGNSSASPYVGAYQSFGYWQITWSGYSGSPIYFGVDQTWYSGSSWTRPIFTGDNPLSTSFATSCAYSDDGKNFLFLETVSYVTLDNFDWQGKCWTPANNANEQETIYSYQTDHIIIENSYFHGWTVVEGNLSGTHALSNHVIVHGSDTGSLGYANHNQFIADVFDGSDSSQGAANSAGCAIVVNAGSPCVSGFGLDVDAYDVHNSVFRYLADAMIPNNLYTNHDNLYEYIFPSFDDATHPDVIYMDGDSGANQYVYNNIFRHTYVNVTNDFYVSSGYALYFFNNVLLDNSNTYGTGVSSVNCLLLNNAQASGTVSAYLYNNTIDGFLAAQTTDSCSVTLANTNSPSYAFKGTVYLQNNHWISYSSSTSMRQCESGATCNFTDYGNDVFQSESTANGQGYTPSNNYAPTSGGATLGAGANNTSLCSTFSADGAMCSGTSGGASQQSGNGGEMADYPAIPMVPRSSTWDAGAYESSSLNPPTGLTAAVQ
jgi:hypothetical protein